MNALWITRMSNYKNSSICIETARQVVAIKIEREVSLLKKYRRSILATKIRNKSSIAEILLEEARMAKQFWREFGKLLYPKIVFLNRKPKSVDAVNHLLDVGYHHLTNVVKKILNKYNIPMDLGIFHIARNSNSQPLAYDLVEMFRSDIVDAEVLRFLRLKKKKPEKINDQISHFLYEINKKLDKKFYLKDFHRCHSYKYYMEVQILKFIKAVNHKQIFEPITLPQRHENT